MIKEEEILLLNNPYASWHYCCVVNHNANIELHEDIIINSNNPYWMFHFAFIKKSNKEKLFEALLKTKDTTYINRFLDQIDLPKKLKDLVIFL